MKTIPAIIVPTIAAGSNSSPYVVNVNITQQLCQPACVDETPVFTPAFSVAEISGAGIANVYNITIHVEGVVSYTPCYGGSCCTRSQIISQEFVIPVSSAAVITGATISQGTPSNAIVKNACCNCSKTFASDNTLKVTIVTA